MSRQSIIDTAAAESGTKESPPNSNRTKYGAWFGFDGAPWCAMFVSWVYDMAGHPLGKVETPRGFKYCPSGYNFWKANNRLTEDPQPGDIVLFDWNGDGTCDHTGIFIRWIEEGKTFASWEGNTSVSNDSDGGEVMTRTRKKSVVKAFVNTGLFNDNIAPVPSTLRRGDVGSEVTRIQKMLYDFGYDMVVDGDFGPGTEAAVKKFQGEHGLMVTGTVDVATEGAIESEKNKPKVKDSKLTTGVYLKKGDAGAPVLALQKALNRRGAKRIVEDGVFGGETVVALKAFQKANKLTVDGVAGPEACKRLGIK
ncbi:MAG: peptidoglycan-binding protein [Cyclobacteriaceae bacterium]|nr:peptidoglycan-binding protein [Cyclobacteriaceae bacterium]